MLSKPFHGIRKVIVIVDEGINNTCVILKKRIVLIIFYKREELPKVDNRLGCQTLCTFSTHLMLSYQYFSYFHPYEKHNAKRVQSLNKSL